MCTWPRGDYFLDSLSEDVPGPNDYNECMTGFEDQVAAHMISEGTVDLLGGVTLQSGDVLTLRA